MTYHINNPSKSPDDTNPGTSLDASLDALLDEALAPDEPSPQLEEQIFAATRKHLVSGSSRSWHPWHPRHPWHRRAFRLGAVASLSAAAVIGAAVVGQWLAMVVHRSDRELLALQAEIDAMVEVVQVEAPIDQQIDRLAARIDHADNPDPWDASRDELDAALREWQTTWNSRNSSF